ncbi:ABC transporter permease subunit [Bacillus sp. JJ1609]|uniref:ABC transporter permease subunit n=1 Tax=Bacillus sp. JJ1609 TaxID=3122977 RepID=UPI002FFFF436
MRNIPLLMGTILFTIYLIFAVGGSNLPFVDSELKEEVMRKDAAGHLSIPPYPPSNTNWLGSDKSGRDLFSLLVTGTRETMILVFLIAGLRYLLALPLGAAAANFKIFRWILDSWNYLLSFIPPIFLVALIIGIPFIYFSKSIFFWYVFILAIIEVGRVSELVRSQMAELSVKEFMEAAETSGTNKLNMLRRHYWPHLRPLVLTSFATDLGRVLFLMSQLGVIQIFVSRKFVSTLGGAYANISTSLSYPVMLQDILRDIWVNTWIPYYTVLFISLMIISFFLLAEGLKKHFMHKYRMI